ncbi:hypothetical protein L7F22_068524 [Adiantum nelumboides]|nr:hypothetical protein [Adiantum nelumboides]
MVFVGYGDRFGIKAYRLYHPQQKKFHFAHSVYFDEVNPQTKWEEAEHLLNPIAQVQAPVLPVQPHQSHVAPPNPIPTPQRPVPAWSLGRKTNSLLFSKSPNPLFPRKDIFKRGLLLQPSLSPASSVAEPLAGDVFPHQGSSGSLKQPLPSSTTTTEEIYPDSPVEPLKQPVLLGRPSTPGSMSKLKTRSLKEIYDSSNLAILFDSEVQPPATPNFIAPTSSTNLKVADAFVLQVLHASMNAPFDPGIQVFQDALQGLIKISQQSYIGSLLKKYDMEACKGVDTPLPANLKIKKIDDSDSILTVQPFPYANILGGVHYLVTCTRPDICFAANLLSRFMQSPGAAHIQNLKRLLCYLKHTKNLGLIYRAADPLPSPFLIGYPDADWGGDQDTLQSTSGYVFLLSGGAISWQSKKQDRVTLSSTEAEYVAMALSLKEGLWLKHLLQETTLFPIQPLTLHCDNMSAIVLARNLKHSEKTKHIALKLLFIRELIQEGSIQLNHVRTDFQWADFQTKPLPKAKHTLSCQQLGLESL